MDEIWKDIEGYEGLYQISNFGRVKSLSRFNSRTERILKLSVRNKTYIKTCLCKENKSTTPENKEQVNHIDGNKTNNIVSNLEWCTRIENMQHAVDTGLKYHTGSNNPDARLTEQQVLEIRASNESQRSLGRKYGVDKSTIGRVKRRDNWTHI